MSETHTFRIELWDMAPTEWCTPEDRKQHRVVDARMVGERGNEAILLEIERSEVSVDTSE